MDFVLFGHVRGMHQGQPVELGHQPERCLPGLLLIEAGRPVSPDRLAELLWDGFRVHTSIAFVRSQQGHLADGHQARARLDGP